MTEQAALLEDEKRRSVLLSPLKRNESKLSKLLMKLRLNFGDVVKIDGMTPFSHVNPTITQFSVLFRS